jgi:hypothetical protein
MRKSLAPVSIDLGIRHTMLVSTFKSCAARMKMSLKRAVTTEGTDRKWEADALRAKNFRQGSQLQTD